MAQAAFLPEEEFAPHIDKGRLVRVMENWCAPSGGPRLAQFPALAAS